MKIKNGDDKLDLKEYKEKYKLNQKMLAVLFRVSETTIHNWIFGHSVPSAKNSFRIFKKTKGEVSISDFCKSKESIQ